MNHNFTVPTPAPAKTPYPFQEIGIDYLIKQRGGFLWDEPGLGKTYQAIVAARNLLNTITPLPDSPERVKPILIICPNAVKSWWRKEIAAVYPNDKHRIAVSSTGGRFDYTDKKFRHTSSIQPHYFYGHNNNPNNSNHIIWYITHYAGARIQRQSYAEIDWAIIILDEAHYIKNRKTQRSKAIHHMTPKKSIKIGLTATPFGRNPSDVWSQLYWSHPEAEPLQSFWRFFNHFVDYTTERGPRGQRYKKINGGKNLSLLAKLMSAFGLQRSKKEVAPQLPAITDTDMPIHLNGRQALVYNALKDASNVELVIRHTDKPSIPTSAQQEELASNGHPIPGTKGDERRITGILIKNAISRLIRMEQWLSCPWDFDPGMKGGKLEWLEQWAASYTYPAVIVTRFKSTAKRIANELNGPTQDQEIATTRCKLITGDVPVKIRATTLEDWKQGKFQFIVGTIHALATGLNLQYAHQMICFDQLWDPILMEQVRHRIHRIDNDHPVEVVSLYFPNTSNALILEAFRRKWGQMNLVRQFLRYLRTGEAVQS